MNYRIARGHTAADWRRLSLDPKQPQSETWANAVAMFRARMEERFFIPVDTLIDMQEDSSRTHGFVVLAIDCLLIETLQGFREGLGDHNRRSKKLFKGFLTSWDVFLNCVPKDGNPDELADLVYTDYRCALLHSGCTANGLKVGVTGKAFAFKSGGALKINRTALHKGLKASFEGYLAELIAPEGTKLRENFKKKMDAICGV